MHLFIQTRPSSTNDKNESPNQISEAKIRRNINKAH